MTKVKIGILELGYRAGSDSLSIVNDILQYGIKAEELNFSRLWLAEHHNAHPLHPYTNPEIVMTLLAGYTDRIRIGSAGALIGYGSPYFLASNYKLMNNLFNDRIDFGFSKGRPANYSKHDYFGGKGQEHIQLFRNNLNAICDLYLNEQEKYEEQDIVLPPFAGQLPQLWYLSNSYTDAGLAISRKMNYCRSLIHGLGILNKNYHRDELDEYRGRFRETNGYCPDTAIALAVSFRKTAAEIAEAEARAVNPREAFSVIPVTPGSLGDLIGSYQELYGMNEFVIYDVETDPAIKLENLFKISETFSLC
ncbi:MAG: LLM class flavin-dependent oxidoreductase [Bacteroidetes bacterium]|nr:LLM class flavin-dependent oxidoreductase [Bacteroidota bacterium]